MATSVDYAKGNFKLGSKAIIDMPQDSVLNGLAEPLDDLFRGLFYLAEALQATQAKLDQLEASIRRLESRGVGVLNR
jgi:hypothetical protein